MELYEAKYDALDIAAYCVNRCIDIGRPVSNLQLQKILYYVQANFLCKKNAPCFKDDIVNWMYGPVVEDVYNEYRINSAKKIVDRTTQKNITSIEKDSKGLYSINTQKVDIDFSAISADDMEIINDVCDRFSIFSGYDLISRTHSEAPWKNTHTYEIISNQSILAYFTNNATRL